MERNTRILAGKIAAITLALPVLIFAFSSGPDPRNTGAPGDTTCAQSGCHLGSLNRGGGSVEVTFPGGLTYTPGTKQRFQVKVTDATAKVYGFQLTVRLGSNERNGQAGTFTPADRTTQVLCEDGTVRGANGCRASAPLEFIEHTNAGPSNTFSFDWTPPATDVGPVKIYVAGNAANGNGLADSNGNDHIYTASYTLTPGGGTANPKPSISGVTNGGSFASGIVSGSWVTIFGKDFTANTRTWRDDEIVKGVLPKSLDGVGVKVNGKDAAVYVISPTQLNIQAPTDTAEGPVQVVVTNSNGTSDAFTASLLKNQPALFAFSPQGSKYPAAVRSDGAYIGPAALFGTALTTVPAKKGDIILLFGTGFGATTPAVAAGAIFSGAAPVNDKVTITIGGVDATVQFAGLVGAGLYQFNVVVPQTVPTSPADQPLVIRQGSLQTQALSLTIGQ